MIKWFSEAMDRMKYSGENMWFKREPPRVIVTGSLSAAIMKDFLNDFNHPDREKEGRIVFVTLLDTETPSMEL